MDASIYANEIFTEFVTTKTELFSVLCVFPINIYECIPPAKTCFTGGVFYIVSPLSIGEGDAGEATIRRCIYR